MNKDILNGEAEARQTRALRLLDPSLQVEDVRAENSVCRQHARTESLTHTWSGWLNRRQHSTNDNGCRAGCCCWLPLLALVMMMQVGAKQLSPCTLAAAASRSVGRSIKRHWWNIARPIDYRATDKDVDNSLKTYIYLSRVSFSRACWDGVCSISRGQWRNGIGNYSVHGGP